MRVLIADDLPDHIYVLESLLEAYPDVKVVGRATSLSALDEQFLNLRPDVVFLDIHFHDENSMPLISKIHRLESKVVLVSSYPEHAVEAFEQHVEDYLLKPVTSKRLADTVDRLRNEIQDKKIQDNSSLVVHFGGILKRIEIRLIRSIRSQGNYTSIQWYSGADIRTREPLKKVIQRLPGSCPIFQLSRQLAVNLNLVTEVHPLPNGRLQLTLDDEEKLVCSKRRAHDFRIAFLKALT